MNFWEKKLDLDKTRFLYEFFLNPIFLRSTRAADHKINMLIVQSLDSPFFPPHIGAEPGRAKEESGITCMRMLRTNQSIPRCSPTVLYYHDQTFPFEFLGGSHRIPWKSKSAFYRLQIPALVPEIFKLKKNCVKYAKESSDDVIQ